MSTASKVYPNQKKIPPDPWFKGLQTPPNGRVVTKGAVPVKTAKNAPGNQGTKNAHTKPSAIKPVGSDAALGKIGDFGGKTSPAPLLKVGGNQLGDKHGANNAQALKLRAMYPSSHTDTSRKL